MGISVLMGISELSSGEKKKVLATPGLMALTLDYIICDELKEILEGDIVL